MVANFTSVKTEPETWTHCQNVRVGVVTYTVHGHTVCLQHITGGHL